MCDYVPDIKMTAVAYTQMWNLKSKSWLHKNWRLNYWYQKHEKDIETKGPHKVEY